MGKSASADHRNTKGKDLGDEPRDPSKESIKDG